MPSFISKNGVWEPATERHVDPKAPIGQEIYQGPDRAAVQMLREAGVESFGQRFDLDPEMIMRARQLGFTTVAEYLKMYGYDQKKADAVYEQRKAEIIRHQDVPRKPAGAFMGGGADSSGQGQDRAGGFKIPGDVPRANANVHLTDDQVVRPAQEQ